MHPFALYLAATDAEQRYGSASRRIDGIQYASVDAAPLVEPETPSRFSRLAALIRRRVARLARVASA